MSAIPFPALVQFAINPVESTKIGMRDDHSNPNEVSSLSSPVKPVVNEQGRLIAAFQH